MHSNPDLLSGLIEENETNSNTVTIEEIMAARTKNGGWTKATLSQWGVDWPPQKGWIKRITETHKSAEIN